MKKTISFFTLLLTALLLLSLFSGCGETDLSEQNLIKQQVIYDKDGIKVTAKAYGDSKTLRDFAVFIIENRSDFAIYAYISASTANRYMMEAPFVEKIGAGETVTAKAVFEEDALRLAGITDIGQMEITLTVEDADTLEPIGISETFSVSLPDFDKNTVKTWENGRELFSREGIRLSAFCVTEKGENKLIFFTENKTDKEVFLCTKEVFVDGKPISGLYAEILTDDTMNRSEFLNFDGLLKQEGIEDLQKITLTFEVYERVRTEGIQASEALLFVTDPITFPFAP